MDILFRLLCWLFPVPIDRQIDYVVQQMDRARALGMSNQEVGDMWYRALVGSNRLMSPPMLFRNLIDEWEAEKEVTGDRA